MGTYITVALPKKHKNLFKEVFDIFKEVELIFSKYNPKAYVYKLNSKKKMPVNEEFLKLFYISKEVYRRTYGYFDITLGNITKKYGNFYIGQNSSTEKSYGFKNVVIKDGYVFLESGVSLDFGGIGKGYAVDKASKFLKEKKVKKAVILASGDIRCFDFCEVGIKNPFGEGIVFKFKTKNKNSSISTSGNYERFIGSKSNNHLINPKTGKSQINFASITLIGVDNNTLIDAYATAVSVMSVSEALEFLNKKNLAYIIFTTDKRVIKSKNLCEFIVCN